MGRGCSRPLLGHGPSGQLADRTMWPVGDDRQISSKDQRSVKLRVRPSLTGTHRCHSIDPDRQEDHAHSQVEEKRA